MALKRIRNKMEDGWIEKDREPSQPVSLPRRKVKISSRYFSVQEVADLFGVSLDILYKAIKQGQLEAQPFGRVYRISEDALSEYLESQRKRKLG